MAVRGFFYEEQRSAGVDSGAVFSPDQMYRYVLWRTWDEKVHRSLVVIGLNPSTADATTDDQTIRRCVGFAKREGCGGLVMLNLFAFRATEPRDMLVAADPVGPENDGYLLRYAGDTTSLTVAAWGALGGTRGRDQAVERIFGKLHCLGRTKQGQPRHPLYLRNDAPLEQWSPAR